MPASEARGIQGAEIERLIAQGTQALDLALPWSEAVRSALDRFEEQVRPLELSDDRHHHLAESFGITKLYDQLDALVIAGGEAC